MTRRSTGRHLAILGLLAALAYAPALFLPLIEDDYPNLTYALQHGSAAGAAGLLHDAIFRARATSVWFMYGLWRMFGLAPWAFHAASLLLHVANCWLVWGIAGSLFEPRMDTDEHGWEFWAAAFFAVYEGHQEAVMWFSACNELLAFFFGAAALLLWMRGRTAASAAVFALALLSKESAVIWLALFVLASGTGARGRGPGARGRCGPSGRSLLLRLAPHVLLAAAAVAAVWMTRAYSFRFSDGSFSLQAPFWIAWPRGMARLMWPWGWLALALVRRESLRPLLWMGIALVPYSFLTYSTQIPSRQTYLASAGLALLVGMAIKKGTDAFSARGVPVAGGLRIRKCVCPLFAVLVLGVNIGYLWTKKRAQFVERAAPTEELIRLARQTNGPIWVECFPRNRLIAEEAVHMGAGKSPAILRWEPTPGAVTFCYKRSR